MAIWIIEQNYGPGDWRPVDTCGSSELEAYSNFYDAHAAKREMVAMWWDISKADEKRNFRITKYERSK